MDNDLKHTSKVVAKWLKDNKFKVLEWLSQSPVLKPIENLWAELRKCVWARKPTNLTQLHQLCQEEWATKFTQLIVGSVWKATQNVWPKLKNGNAMLPNTNWEYVNFWPTGNVMKEIKAVINHSLYYYSDISHSSNKVVILTDLSQGIFTKCQELWKTEFKCIWLKSM